MEARPAWQEAIQVGAGMLTAPDADRFKAVLFAAAKKNREDIQLLLGERTVLAMKARTADLVRSGADK